MGKTLNIGWSTKSITPYGRKVSLSGQFYERIASEVDYEITATALAMDNGDATVTWVSCDLCNMFEIMSEDVRELVKRKAPELKTGHIVCSVTHTHCSPYIKSAPKAGIKSNYKPPEGVMGIEEYHDFVANVISDAVIEANQNKISGCYIQTAVSPVQTGCCRRGIINTGEAVMYIDTSRPDFVRMEGPDSGPISLMFIRDEKDSLKGVIACIPCTAQILEHQYCISSDYIGRVRALLKNKYGDKFLFMPLISSTGNLSPRNLLTKDYGYGNMYDKDGADHMGKRIFNAIIMEVDNPVETYKDFSTFGVAVKKLKLPGWLPTAAEYQWAVALKDTDRIKYDIKDYVQKGIEPYFRTPLALAKRVEAVIARFENKAAYETVNTEITALRIGNTGWVSNPFELYQEYAGRMLRRCKARNLWSIQKTYDHLGYLPTMQAVWAGGYSGYICNGMVDPAQGGELLVKESVDLVDSLF
ncbi:MAG TPA: hypothetical protein GXX20_01500 [Clostridiaceae bacterium]|nr:hypothetical protein [Clostridiaceae bacterium]